MSAILPPGVGAFSAAPCGGQVPPMADAVDQGPLVGILRSWRDPWGFIVCPGTFEGDLFAHRENFVGGIPPGDLTGASVQFRRNVDNKGRPHASEIVLLQQLDPQGGVADPTMVVGHAVDPRTTVIPMATALQVPGSSRASAEKLISFVGTRLRGKIRSWKDDWGFLTCSKFEGDLFVHRQHLRFEGDPVVGKPVSFSVAIDSKNRATAAEVTEPTPAPEDFEGGTALTGRIRSWKNEWGFIVAPEHFEGDLFCHREHVTLDMPLANPADMAQVVVNRSVSFEVMTDTKGRAHAAKVFLLDAPPVMPAHIPGMPTAPGMAVGEQLLDNGEVLTGALRSWREPWGFIICPDRFEGDLFVHKDAFIGETPGTACAGRPVQFQRAVDQRGRPHASQVRLLGPPPQPQQPDAAAASSLLLPSMQENPFVKLDSMLAAEGVQGVPGIPSIASVPMQNTKFEHCMGMQVTGTCRSWKGEWGFVVSESFEGDLFAHKMNLQNGADCLTPGAVVTFEVGGDSKGRATALNIRCLTEAKDAVQQLLPQDWAGTGVQLQGTVRSYREPWGFLVSPGSYSSDLFFHVEHVHPATRVLLRSGLEVTFRVENDKKGRCTAMDIQFCAAKRKLPVMAAQPLLQGPPLKRPKL